MNDVISEFIATDGPVEREVSYHGVTKTLFFRRLTAGERMQLTRGHKITTKNDENSYNVDLSEYVGNNHKLVQFSTCDANGKSIFKTLGDVQKLPDSFVAVLLEHANEVNKDEEVGKA